MIETLVPAPAWQDEQAAAYVAARSSNDEAGQQAIVATIVKAFGPYLEFMAKSARRVFLPRPDARVLTCFRGPTFRQIRPARPTSVYRVAPPGRLKSVGAAALQAGNSEAVNPQALSRSEDGGGGAGVLGDSPARPEA